MLYKLIKNGTPCRKPKERMHCLIHMETRRRELVSQGIGVKFKGTDYGRIMTADNGEVYVMEVISS